MSNIGALLQNLEQVLSKMGILASKLEGESWKDHLEIAVVLEVSGAEEAGPELSTLKRCLGERLGDG